MYAKIKQISTVNARGENVSFLLYKRDGTEPDPIPKFDIYGYKFRFSLSKFGFGILNTEVAVDILDDDDRTLFGVFNNAADREEYAIQITIDDDEIFWGFPDYEQLRTKLFPQAKTGISVKFYNPMQLLNDIQFNSPALYNNNFIRPSQSNEGDSNIINPTYIRIGRLVTDFIFNNFNSDGYLVSEFLPPFTDWDSELSTNERRIFNAVYFDATPFLQDDNDDSLIDVFAQIIRSFFMRAGFSYTRQKPVICRVDISEDIFLYKYGDTKVFRPGGTGIGYWAVINEVDDPISDDFLVIEKNKIARNATFKEINPYGSITYRQVQDITDPDPDTDIVIDGNRLTLILEEGAKRDGFESDEIPFSASELDSDPVLLMLSEIGGSPSQRVLENFTSLKITLPGVLARLHETMRKATCLDVRFTYNGYLDPMRTYKTDFDDNAYIITRGEYDLIRGQTIIQESISQPIEEE